MYPHRYLCPTIKRHILLSRENRWRRQAELLNLSGAARLRLEWIIFYHTAGRQAAQATARHFGIARSKFYYWLKRFDERSLKRLEDVPSVPKKKRRWQPDPLVLSRMIGLRKEFPWWGKMKLAAVYKQRYGERIAPWQFQRVITEFKLARRKKSSAFQRNGAAKQRISLAVRQSCRYLIQLDTIVLHLFGQKRYILTAVEHTSKLAYAHVSKSHSSAAARTFLERLLYLVEGQIGVVLTDNGSEFQKHFAQACEIAKITRYYTKPNTPQDNPECERFNRTLQEEWLNEGNWYTDIHSMNRSLTDWLVIYNNVRPHQSLQYATPLAKATAIGLLSKRSSSSTETVFGGTICYHQATRRERLYF